MQELVSKRPNLKLVMTAALVVLGVMLLIVLDGKVSHAAIKPIDVYVDDNQVTFTIDPDVKDGTTVVQMRPLFEALGMEIVWNEADRSVTAEKEGFKLLLTLGSQDAEVNGRFMKLDRPAVAVKGHTLVPLRFVSESTDALVHWNGVHREIIVYTTEYLSSYGLTKEEVKLQIDDLQKQIDAEYAASKEDEKSDRDPTVVLPPSVADDSNPIRLDQLEGMYYGGAFDFGGYECGGTCWKFYTFLPDQKVVVGLPKGGGPETVDCKKDACLSYTIKNGMLNIKGEEPISIAITKKGTLEIDEVLLEKAVPVPEGTKIGGEYLSRGYSGLVGITPYSTSWTYYLTFYSDGTFESDRSSIASLDTGSARTDSSSASDTVGGTYKIGKNTIEFTYDNGDVERYLFAVSPHEGEGTIFVQIGDKNFYIEVD